METVLDKNLRYLLKLKKLEIKQLSNEAGIPYSTCHDAIYGAKVTMPVNVAKFARFFNLTMEQILFTDLSEEDNASPVKQ